MKLKEVLQILDLELHLPGFKSRIKRGQISFVRKGNGFSDYITLSSSIWSSGVRLGSIVVGFKDFDIVEKILDKHYRSLSESRPSNTLMKQAIACPEIKENVLQDTVDVHRVLPYIRERLQSEILPFFDAFPDIKSVYEHIENSDLNEIYTLLGNPGGSLRRLIIKALVKAPDFEEFGKQMLKEAQMYILKYDSPNYELVLQILPNLMEELREIYNGPVVIEGDINYSIGPYIDTSEYQQP